jgi:hypothetical protein
LITSNKTLATITGNAGIKTPYMIKVIHPKIFKILNFKALVTIKEYAKNIEAKYPIHTTIVLFFANVVGDDCYA